MASTMFRSSQVRSLDPRRLMAEFEFVLVLTTLPGDADAASFARTLVEDRLAACVNLLPLMESVFRWEGRIDRDTERHIVRNDANHYAGTLRGPVSQNAAPAS